MKRCINGAIAASIASLGVNTAAASLGRLSSTLTGLQGVWTQPGSHFDLRYEYIDQDQPLPTGKIDVANAQGEVVERSLQPGSGTTQLALSAYFREALPMVNSSWYAQAAALLPLNYRDDYKPGNQLGFDLGYRYDVPDKLGLNLQLNYVFKARSKGAQAEPEDSGGQTVAITPGITYAFTPAVQAYAFLQLPIYQYVNGVQLTANWSATTGLSVQF
jgi:opacity protein-like surface antigen